MISSARRSVLCARSISPSRIATRRLAQEAPGAVVEHHDQLPGRGREDRALTVGLR